MLRTHWSPHARRNVGSIQRGITGEIPGMGRYTCEENLTIKMLHCYDRVDVKRMFSLVGESGNGGRNLKISGHTFRRGMGQLFFNLR